MRLVVIKDLWSISWGGDKIDPTFDLRLIYILVSSLKELWPTRVHSIKYETLAKHPFRSMIELSSALGKGSKLNEKTVSWISENMLAEQNLEPETPFEVHVHRALSHVKKLTKDFDLTNESTCRNLIKTLNY